LSAQVVRSSTQHDNISTFDLNLDPYYWWIHFVSRTPEVYANCLVDVTDDLYIVSAA